MSVYISKNERGQECFNLYHLNKKGVLEKRVKNKQPRGDVYHRLLDLEWEASHKRVDGCVAEMKELLGELQEAKIVPDPDLF